MKWGGDRKDRYTQCPPPIQWMSTGSLDYSKSVIIRVKRSFNRKLIRRLGVVNGRNLKTNDKSAIHIRTVNRYIPAASGILRSRKAYPIDSTTLSHSHQQHSKCHRVLQKNRFPQESKKASATG